MSKVYIADKVTLDKVRENTDFIIANLMALNDDDATRTKVAENYFNTKRTGKVFGVKFNAFTSNSSPKGTRLYDAANMIARPSTDTLADRNDFEEYAIFNGLTVNGKVETNGDFTVTAFEGEEGFSKTKKDVFILLGTPWIKIDIDSTGETIAVTDKPRDGYFPAGGAIRTNKAIRPFIPMAKYLASDGEDGSPSSTSGKIPYHNNVSESACITKFHNKGTQYCAETFQDRFLIETMFQVMFATRDSQSIMAGCTSYNYQRKVAKAEEKVNRVLVTQDQGKEFIVGSRVSVGEPGASTNLDRNQTNMNSIADRRLITKIENITDSGSSYAAIYLDGAAFTTTATCYISTMPWDTGVCDCVLGTCGTPVNNTDGKRPYVFMGIEMSNGQYTVLGNALYEQATGTGKYYVCYDATKLASAHTDENFKLVGYELNSGTEAKWLYTSELGFDPANPSARFPKGTAATSSTGYCDGVYVNAPVAGDREVLCGGRLDGGTAAGVFCRDLGSAVGATNWAFSARLSATGICGQSAA